MATATINISLPDTLKGQVEEVIEKDGYGNASEFFRELVRNYLKQREQQQFEALLLEGLRSGETTPLTKADFEAIRKRGIERLKERKKS